MSDSGQDRTTTTLDDSTTTKNGSTITPLAPPKPRPLKRPGNASLEAFRRHSSIHYQTFPSLRPPKDKGRPLQADGVKRLSSNASGTAGENSTDGNMTDSSGNNDNSNNNGRRISYRNGKRRKQTPIPIRQLLILGVIALAEQTAFNSISPYLPEMVGLFPEVSEEEVGVSVGMIASAFAVAQFVTNFFWGYLSDRIGRKPVILCGTILTACAFALFAFTRTLKEAIIVQALMGIVNGNQGVVSTVLGEITDRSNQSAAFAYLPMVYGIGAIIGPIVGGLLSSSKESKYELLRRFPYCLPNIASAILLVVDFALCLVFLDESLADARDLPPLQDRIRDAFTWLWQFTTSTRPTYLRHGKRNDEDLEPEEIAQNTEVEPLIRDSSIAYDEGSDSDEDDENGLPSLFSSSVPVPWKKILTPSTISLLVTYFIFNLSMIGYNALYPIFVSSSPPTGRATPVREVGLSLGFAGLVTIIFQVGVFAKMQDRLGNTRSFRASLGIFALTFFAMPFIGYSDKIGKGWLWAELAVVLAIKVVSSITALTCAMILITNCAPNPSSLGSINGLAQTLSAAGRAFGPFAAGGLFTLGTRLRKGEWLPWGIFGGIAIIGFLASFAIKRQADEGASVEDPGAESEASADASTGGV